jgi:SH3-like domain-containing protein
LIGLDAAGSLPVREGPLDTARLVATLPSTASGIADLNTCVREWCLIEQGGIKGYVLSRFLTRMAGASDQRYSIDGEESVKVVSYASADAGVVGEIPFYASGIVPIGECNAQWCHVRYLGLVGWVDTRSLRLESGPSG